MLAVTPQQVRACLTPTVVPTADGLLGGGLGVAPGAGSGRVVFSSDEAGRVGARGDRCVLVVSDLRPEDVGSGRHLAGLVTLRGGATSHAAVVAKGLGLPMIAGLRDAVLDCASGVLRIGGRTVSRDDVVTVDGSRGHLYPGSATVTDGSMTPALAELIGWAERFLTIQVQANADTGEDVRTAKELGASGVGLCRLEHVLAAGGGTAQLRQALTREDPAARARAVADVTQLLTALLTDILLAAEDVPVTIRLLDAARHELVDDSVDDTGPAAGIAELNPMMGTRGVRDFLVNADLGVAQVIAIARSRRAVTELGLRTDVRILVPMVGFSEEFRRARQVIEAVFARETPGAHSGPPAVGCMIEVPRIALNAADLAAHADFLSIGSNDLTQFTLAVSRDDAEVSFFASYLRDQVIATNPFEHLDREGVGRILRLCIDEARTRRPDLPIGLCGEHAGDAASVEYLLRSAAMAGDTSLRGKLVRDRIPEIILREGLVPIVETASPRDYDRYVRAKLEEELEEYLSSGDVAEVADLVEVCFAAAALHGVTPDELLAIAREKRQQRGGFHDRLVWMGNLPGGHERTAES